MSVSVWIIRTRRSLGRAFPNQGFTRMLILGGRRLWGRVLEPPPNNLTVSPVYLRDAPKRIGDKENSCYISNPDGCSSLIFITLKHERFLASSVIQAYCLFHTA